MSRSAPATAAGLKPSLQREADAAQAAMFDAAGEVAGSDRNMDNGVRTKLLGGHSRRAWLLLGERVFSHPRYAVLIVAALALCAFERYLWVMIPLALFFSVEWSLRLWLQRENGWKNRGELVFLLLDGIATISLFATIFVSSSLLSQGFYLRLARLFRGAYLLRMLRVFRFLTRETFIYSLPFALLVVALAAVALAVEGAALYLGLVLLLELAFRGASIMKVLPDGHRRRTEYLFLPLDLFATIALLNFIPELSPLWIVLRLPRFLIMLNPLGTIATAVKKVVSSPEVQSEISMLMWMLLLLLVAGSLSVLYFYPEMDINNDRVVNMRDHGLLQVILFVFRLIMDPGLTPPMAYSPWLVGLSILLAIAGVFFFALMVGFGSNVMRSLMRELSNSSLSTREQLLFVGGNAESIPILKQLDRLYARMRRSIPSLWIFFGEPLPAARSVGGWLAVRQVERGERDLIRRFKIGGIHQLFFFHPAKEIESQHHLVDMHHLKRDAAVDGVVVSDRALPAKIESLYRESLNMRVFDSASAAARMLYQMHHCAHMPELGMRLLDVVEGETGLFSLRWPLKVVQSGGSAEITHDGRSLALELWLTACFAQGINLLAAVDAEGDSILFSDLMRLGGEQSFSDVIAIGNRPALWPGMMIRALSHDAESHENRLKAFTWPESWDLSMIFLGWHQGLPAMIQEMALKHHKLTVHLFSTGDELFLEQEREQLNSVVADCGNCELSVLVHAWDGMDAEALVPHLRGCKVVMLYPEHQQAGSEDSLLELWYHEVAGMLSARKAKAKWWTPPKLMVLPRHGAHVAGFVEAANLYPLLDTDVGSPDAFHDIFMARQLLNEAGRAVDADTAHSNDKLFAFVDALLSDAVLVESVATERLLNVSADGEAVDWRLLYRESLRRGWLLMAYLMPQHKREGWNMFDSLDAAFPSPQNDHLHAMHLLGGTRVEEMDMPLESEAFLFCRRGVLKQSEVDEGEASAEVKTVEEVEVEVEIDRGAEQSLATREALINSMNGNHESRITNPCVENLINSDAIACDSRLGLGDSESHELPSRINQRFPNSVVDDENILEGEVMSDSVWPKVADRRLIQVLEKQVEGSLQLLDESTEDGLIKLTEILDMGVSAEVEERIMAALTDLQNIDRVSQRMNNVKSCLHDWGSAALEPTAKALWRDTVEKRYVMEEERIVLKEAL